MKIRLTNIVDKLYEFANTKNTIALHRCECKPNVKICCMCYLKIKNNMCPCCKKPI